MKLTILLGSFFLGVAVAIDDSSIAGGIQVWANALDPQECETFRQVTTTSTTAGDDVCNSGRRRQGIAQLSFDVASRLYQAVHPNKHCTCTGSSVNMNKNTLPVVTSLITETTTVHQDKNSNGKLASEQVGFVFLNDNPDASFLYGDDEQVSVEKGKLVTFQGDVLHHTIVRSGQVHLLGPFAISSFRPVGGQPSECDDEDCPFCSGEEGCENDEFVCTCLESPEDDHDYHYDYGVSSTGGQQCRALGDSDVGSEQSLCDGSCDSCRCCLDAQGNLQGPFACECKTSRSSTSTSKSSKGNYVRKIRGLWSKSSKGDECRGTYFKASSCSKRP